MEEEKFAGEASRGSQALRDYILIVPLFEAGLVESKGTYSTYSAQWVFLAV